jgi:tight adherence protein C
VGDRVSRAVLAATLAGALAAAGLVELAAARAARRRTGGGLLLRALAALGRRIGATAPADLAARIDAAGAPLGLTEADLMALKAGAALAAIGLAVLPAAAAPGRLGPLALVVLPAAAFLGPDLWLRRRIRARVDRAERELPDVLDLLRVAVEAGLPLSRALAEVGRRRRGVLGRELRRAADEVLLGRPRRDALAALARRCPAEGIPPLVTALERAERLGAPLGPTLAAQAREARSTRAGRMRERAERAGPKIQLVVALGLVPSVMLLVAAALVSTLGD